MRRRREVLGYSRLTNAGTQGFNGHLTPSPHRSGRQRTGARPGRAAVMDAQCPPLYPSVRDHPSVDPDAHRRHPRQSR